MIKKNKRNVILGLVNYYTYYDIKKFILSLERTGYNGGVVFFVGNGMSPLTLKKIKGHGINLVKFDSIQTLPADSVAKGAFDFKNPTTHNNYRWYLYYDFLTKYRDDYDRILLTDVKDVYFQLDPFNIETRKNLIFVLEGKSKTIKDDEVYNAKWIQHVYGNEGIIRVGDNFISCCGTVMGTANCVYNYIEKILKEYNGISDVSLTLDQGIHNYLLYTGEFPEAQVVSNEDGYVLTIANEKKYFIGDDNNIRSASMRIYNIIHQFDRIPELINITDKLYRRTGIINFILRKYYRVDLFWHRLLLKLKIRK